MWKTIPEFSRYEINEEGIIRNRNNHNILSQRHDARGYLVVALTRDDLVNTTKGVHRCLMETFSPVEDMKNLTVNHINHVKDDNRLENLEWLTNRENVQEAYAAGLHDGKHKGGNNKLAVRCVETGDIYESSAEAAKMIGITSYGKVNDACKDPNKTCGGYHWQFASEEPYSVQDILKQTRRAIKCVETGEIFKDMTAAGHAVNVTRKAISNALDKPNRTSGGYHWQRV